MEDETLFLSMMLQATLRWRSTSNIALEALNGRQGCFSLEHPAGCCERRWVEWRVYEDEAKGIYTEANEYYSPQEKR